VQTRTPAAIVLFILIASLLAWPAQTGAAEPPGDFCVAPGGRDDGPGTADEPFATLERAGDAVREKIAAGLEQDVTVLVRGGTYFLERPLVFTPDDAGTEQHAVRYVAWGGRLPVLSGGRRITGWQQAADGRWTVTLPEVKAGNWHFRQLFVGGRRATRARTPNRSAEEYCWRLLDAELTQDLATHTLTLGPNTVQKWGHIEDVEAVVLKNWATLHKRLADVDPATGVVTLRPPHVKYFGGNRPRKGGGCFFENAPEMLDEPGEWYLDRHTGVLSYLPLAGQDPDEVETIAPALGHVLEVAGTPDRPVRNLHFRGLAVMHNHVPLPPEGHHGRQACFRYGGGPLPCIARLTHAVECSFTGGQVAHTGGNGLGLGKGCRENRIEGNEVFDTAGNGIDVGGPNDEQLVPRGNRIRNNHVHHCGAVYYGACAIWAGFAQDTLVEHNLVCHHPYTGISIGWQWNPSPTASRAYVVRRNHVHDVMLEVCDGGAIYSLGFHPDTVLQENHLHDVHRSRYAIAAPNNGIFMDQGSKGYRVEGNVIYRTSGQPVRHNRNRPEWHTWIDNVLVQGDLPPDEAAEILRRVETAGLEAEWREKLLGDDTGGEPLER